MILKKNKLDILKKKLNIQNYSNLKLNNFQKPKKLNFSNNLINIQQQIAVRKTELAIETIKEKLSSSLMVMMGLTIVKLNHNRLTI